MNEKKTLDDYEQIALDKYGIDSHAVKWVRAQKQNQGTLDMSEETMMKMLERMHKKTAAKQAAAQQTEQTPEVRDQEPVKSMFANLKKNSARAPRHSDIRIENGKIVIEVKPEDVHWLVSQWKPDDEATKEVWRLYDELNQA